MGHSVTELSALEAGVRLSSRFRVVHGLSEPRGSANRAVAGPEGFEPSTIPRTSQLDPSFRLRASA